MAIIDLRKLSKELYKGRTRAPVTTVLNKMTPDAISLVQKHASTGNIAAALSAFTAQGITATPSVILRVNDLIIESAARGLASTFGPRMQQGITRAFDRLRSERTLDDITSLLSQGGVSAVNSLLDNFDDIFTEEVTSEIDSILLESGKQSVNVLPPQSILRAGFVFDSFDRVSAELFQGYKLKFIKDISDTSKAAVRNAVQRSLITGVNPKQTARVFRDTIGLTPYQESVVSNYENSLRNLKTNALKRELRDRRFDSSVLRAISDKKPLSEDQIQRFTQRYRERFIKHRSETISLTESLRVVSIGREEGIRQALVAGNIDGERTRAYWSFTKDSRTRDPHRRVPGMNKEGIRIGELFQTPLGPLEYPRDPRGSAANTVRCRCLKYYRYV